MELSSFQVDLHATLKLYLGKGSGYDLDAVGPTLCMVGLLVRPPAGASGHPS